MEYHIVYNITEPFSKKGIHVMKVNGRDALTWPGHYAPMLGRQFLGVYVPEHADKLREALEKIVAGEQLPSWS